MRYRSLIAVVSIFAVLHCIHAAKFWHLTDVHYDWRYIVCALVLLHLSDWWAQAGGDPKNMCHGSKPMKDGASPVGDYLCDSPLELVESALQQMKKIEPNPDFIIWTGMLIVAIYLFPLCLLLYFMLTLFLSGDDPPHVKQAELNQEDTLRVIKNVTDFITATFPNTVVFPALGSMFHVLSSICFYWFAVALYRVLRITMSMSLQFSYRILNYFGQFLRSDLPQMKWFFDWIFSLLISWQITIPIQRIKCRLCQEISFSRPFLNIGHIGSAQMHWKHYCTVVITQYVFYIDLWTI